MRLPKDIIFIKKQIKNEEDKTGRRRKDPAKVRPTEMISS